MHVIARVFESFMLQRLQELVIEILFVKIEIPVNRQKGLILQDIKKRQIIIRIHNASIAHLVAGGACMVLF